MFSRTNTICPNCGSSALIVQRLEASASAYDMCDNLQAVCLECDMCRRGSVGFSGAWELFRSACSTQSILAALTKGRVYPYRWPEWKRTRLNDLVETRMAKAASILFPLPKEDWLRIPTSSGSPREASAYDAKLMILCGIPEFRGLARLILMGQGSKVTLPHLVAEFGSSAMWKHSSWELLPWSWADLDSLTTTKML